MKAQLLIPDDRHLQGLIAPEPPRQSAVLPPASSPGLSPRGEGTAEGPDRTQGCWMPPAISKATTAVPSPTSQQHRTGSSNAPCAALAAAVGEERPTACPSCPAHHLCLGAVTAHNIPLLPLLIPFEGSTQMLSLKGTSELIQTCLYSLSVFPSLLKAWAAILGE